MIRLFLKPDSEERDDSIVASLDDSRYSVVADYNADRSKIVGFDWADDSGKIIEVRTCAVCLDWSFGFFTRMRPFCCCEASR